MITLYDELIRLFRILNLDITDVVYTDVYDYPNHVDIPVIELLELSKKVPVDIIAEDAVPFDIHFNNGYIIQWNLDREFYEMELRVITFHPRPKEGHIPSLILKGGMNNV